MVHFAQESLSPLFCFYSRLWENRETRCKLAILSLCFPVAENWNSVCEKNTSLEAVGGKWNILSSFLVAVQRELTGTASVWAFRSPLTTRYHRNRTSLYHQGAPLFCCVRAVASTPSASCQCCCTGSTVCCCDCCCVACFRPW